MSGSDCISANSHGLDDGIRVSLHDGAVHECSRVSLVSIADHVFLLRLVLGSNLPLQTGRESSAASSSQAGLLDFIYYGFWTAVEQTVCESKIAVASNILLNILRINQSAVP